jgi:hypothetical protein
MANKYISNNAGQLKEVEGLVTSAGAGDAGKIPALDSSGRLDPSIMPVGTGSESVTIQASENLTAGDFVNIHDSGGSRVRKADASNPAKRAHGYVINNVTSGNTATVYYGNVNTAVTSLTPGVIYYLSGATPGAITATAPTTAGHIVQELGVSRNDTELITEIQRPIELA